MESGVGAAGKTRDSSYAAAPRGGGPFRSRKGEVTPERGFGAIGVAPRATICDRCVRHRRHRDDGDDRERQSRELRLARRGLGCERVGGRRSGGRCRSPGGDAVLAAKLPGARRLLHHRSGRRAGGPLARARRGPARRARCRAVAAAGDRPHRLDDGGPGAGVGGRAARRTVRPGVADGRRQRSVPRRGAGRLRAPLHGAARRGGGARRRRAPSRARALDPRLRRHALCPQPRSRRARGRRRVGSLQRRGPARRSSHRRALGGCHARLAACWRRRRTGGPRRPPSLGQAPRRVGGAGAAGRARGVGATDRLRARSASAPSPGSSRTSCVRGR